MKSFVLLFAALVMGCHSLALAITPEQQSLHVLNRIAYGPTPGDVVRVTQMGVKRYIDIQLDPASMEYPAALAERLNTLDMAKRGAGEALAEFVELRRDVRNEEEGAKKRRAEGVRTMSRQSAEARLLRAIHSPRQLEEVMVDFWYNHFNVFEGKGPDRALVASYERDAIRPFVFGPFRSLLGATAKHPAMLYYLDNQLSKAGALNENYARELMELHTMGVNGGYTQKDVTELARMLTGWGYDQRALIRRGELFRFDMRRHDQEPKTWLGQQVVQTGQAEGEFALDVLARHPATARNVSYKLAQYFVQDAPPAALVERMARTWRDTDGDIRAVMRTLLASEEFMAPAAIGAKFKTPYQYVVSVARAGGAGVDNVAPLLQSLVQLGMPLYGCVTPDGYKNTEAAWLNPGALTRRIAFATTTATAAKLDPLQLDGAVGAAISTRTRAMVAASPAPLRAAMLLGSPDFMQR